jgi:hypothetical protein
VLDKKKIMKKKLDKYSSVFHVGFLNIENLSKSRPAVHMSLEGNGLSVSLCPEEWTQIAKLGGSNLYTLTKSNPSFLKATESNKEKAIQWCLDNEFLIEKKKYRAYSTNEDGEERYMEFDTAADAEREELNDVRPTAGYSFGPKGKAYWKQSFSSKISHDMAGDFAIIFYAEANGYDGVWWDDALDISNFSAPRGVIFQHKLEEWKIKKV